MIIMGRMKEKFMNLINRVMEGETVVVHRGLDNDIKEEVEALFNEEVEVEELEDGLRRIKLKKKYKIDLIKK